MPLRAAATRTWTNATAYRRHHLRTLALVTVAVVLPSRLFLKGDYNNGLVNLFLIYSITVVGFYLMFGLAGQFAFSQAAFMGLGAYTSAWAGRHSNFWVGLAVGVVLSAAVAFALISLLWRSNQFYFAIATLAFGEICLTVFTNWTAFTGPAGQVFTIAAPSIGGTTIRTQSDLFWLYLAGLVVALVAAIWIERSPLRRWLIAERDVSHVVPTLGRNIFLLRAVAFVVGSSFAAFAGALFTSWQGFLTPEAFGIDLGIGIFLMVMLGGIGSPWGGVVGAAIYVFVPERLRGLSQYQELTWGLLLIVVVIVFPDGLVGLKQRVRSVVAAAGRGRSREKSSK